jgi:hypothetical protein
MLMTQIKPGPVLLLRGTYSLTGGLVNQFIPVLKASGYAGQIKPGTATSELKFRVEPQSDHLPNNRIASVIG